MSEDYCEKAVYPFTVMIHTLSPNTAYSFPDALAKTVIFCDVVGRQAGNSAANRTSWVR